jgi:hypothetical protein
MQLKFTLLLAIALVCFNLNGQTKLGTINTDLIIGIAYETEAEKNHILDIINSIINEVEAP